MENKYKRLIINSLWTLGGNTGSKILAFLLLPFYTRWLGTAGYGMSDLISTYSSLMLGLVTLCTADGIFVFTKNKNDEVRTTYYTTLSMFTLCLFLLWAVGCCIVRFLFFDSDSFFVDNIWLIIMMVLSLFIQNYTQQFVISLDKMKVYSLTGMILCLSTFIFSIVMIPRYGVIGYVYSIITANVVTSIYSVLASGSYKNFRINSVDFKIIRPYLIYTIPLIPNSIMWWIVNALNRPLMEEYLGLTQIGIYAVANKFPGIITMLFNIFTVSWNISLFEEYGKPTYTDFYRKTFRTLFLCVFLGCFVLMSLSKYIISIFAAPEFYIAWQFTIILFIGSFFSCISSFFGTTFSVVKQSKYLFYSSIWGAGTSIILNFVLIPYWGVYGACISVCASFFIMAIIRYIYNRRYVKTSLIRDILAYTICLILVSVALILIPNQYISILIILLSIIIVFLSNYSTILRVLSLVKKSICQ